MRGAEHVLAAAPDVAALVDTAAARAQHYAGALALGRQVEARLSAVSTAQPLALVRAKVMLVLVRACSYPT